MVPSVEKDGIVRGRKYDTNSERYRVICVNLWSYFEPYLRSGSRSDLVFEQHEYFVYFRFALLYFRSHAYLINRSRWPLKSMEKDIASSAIKA